jgi:aryl-alcohol dehydrogenase-like predicted oxidoreductase
VFIETKIWISDYGYDQTLHGFEKSARKLGLDQIDLLILHQALPSEFERTLAAYRALDHLLRAKKNGLTETELKEAIIHLAFYACWPRAMSAIQVAKTAFAE